MTRKAKTALSILVAAGKVISAYKHWTTGSYAESKTGKTVKPTAQSACRFCAYGALRHVARIQDWQERIRAEYLLDQAASEIAGLQKSAIQFNDHEHTRAHHKRVKAMFRAAKELARKAAA